MRTSPGGSLRVLLGDQISDGRISSLNGLDRARDTLLFAEVREEAGYVRHHKQKIALVFAAMRGFADRLGAAGANVRYVRLGDPHNTHVLTGEILRAVGSGNFRDVIVTEPGEWRLRQAFAALAETLPVPMIIREDDRFLCSHDEFDRWADGKRTLRMEFFYREMRKKTGLLMKGTEPEGGRWNFDAENRKRLPKSLAPPVHRFVPPNPVTRAVLTDVARDFPDHFGDLELFSYATTPDEAETIRDDFIESVLPGFGDYQDAMASGEPWMWHSILSAAINIGLLDPLDVCRRAEAAYRNGNAPLNAVEGFIRQIIGWREFVRGIYWLKMPEYKETNALGANRRLPWFYWSGETDMNCVRDVVATTRRHGYAHHIQRLMVTGNLAMLLGVAPAEINDWYMAVYADAYEWVELPNTHGMAIFADGGIVGSKPYAAAGAYINRMSDYCRKCRYDPRERFGDNACPFNALYWDFLMRNEALLANNPRMAMPYRNLARMNAGEKSRLRRQAEATRERVGATVIA
jgi:deoxyribodipyrimidine photolyase-related protein